MRRARLPGAVILGAVILVVMVPGLLIAGAARSLEGQALPPPTAVEWSTAPTPAARGSVVWLYVRPAEGPADSAMTLDGTAAGEPLHFERLDDGRYRSLVGIPLEGGDTLPVMLRRSTGAVTDTLVVRLPVVHPAYANERLTVAPRYAEPDSAARARIDAELAQSRAISRRAHDTPRIWSGRFVRPRPTRITSVFGTGREFNGSVTSRHLGTDFAGKVGAPVRAAGRAVVALVARFYLAGNAVYLDHGGGLVTGYFHLSRVLVAEGDTVAAGQVIGAVGRSGRATGPHLHWIARYGGITVDPMSLFALPATPEFGKHPAR
ncbi:MAG TPA: M23 family metallopeptidase [Gemmatimonadales bacterium]|nr:M23 family metallopeptidase [Gemmatimonadales bacterium]